MFVCVERRRRKKRDDEEEDDARWTDQKSEWILYHPRHDHLKVYESNGKESPSRSLGCFWCIAVEGGKRSASTVRSMSQQNRSTLEG